MKVQRLLLRNFKRFRDKEILFTDEESGLAKDLVVLLGPNGAGKSTILQAIAALVGSATGRLRSPLDLDWPGFDLALAGEWWRTPLQAEVDIEFTPDENAATRDYFHRAPGLGDNPAARVPASARVVPLELVDGAVRAPTAEQWFQFHGREYASALLRQGAMGHDVFRPVGTALWYHEHRTSTTISMERSSGSAPSDGSEQTQEIAPDLLRDRLGDLMAFHERVTRREIELRPGRRDLFADLMRLYGLVFPNRKIETSVPRSGVNDVMSAPWLYFWDGSRQYEFVEMSGGERAVFPLLLDFANWNVHNSIVLIDEIELHLHPPLQQALLRALPKLGTNNQFIITTHSDSIEAVVPADAIIRLEGD